MPPATQIRSRYFTAAGPILAVCIGCTSLQVESDGSKASTVLNALQKSESKSRLFVARIAWLLKTREIAREAAQLCSPCLPRNNSHPVLPVPSYRVHFPVADHQSKVLSGCQHARFIEPSPGCWIVTPYGSDHDTLPGNFVFQGSGPTWRTILYSLYVPVVLVPNSFSTLFAICNDRLSFPLWAR